MARSLDTRPASAPPAAALPAALPEPAPGLPRRPPAPLASNVPLPYRFVLPTTNHVFLPGHRVMVQIQSSWFPLYDRNPQTFVPNIFFAEPKDYVKATQRVYRAGSTASFVDLPVVPAATSKGTAPSAQP